MGDLSAGDDHQVIRLGGSAAVVVPLGEYRRLRELERRAELADRVEADEAAALAEYREDRRAGTVTAVPQEEVWRRFGLVR